MTANPLEGTQTLENLKQALIREAVDYQRLHYFAHLADVEGESDVAAVLRHTADGDADRFGRQQPRRRHRG